MKKNSLTNLFASAFLVLTLLFQSCGSSNGNSSSDSAKTNTSVSSPSIPDFTKSLEGTIGGKYGIVITLTKSGNDLSGTYSYKSHAVPIKISGTIDNSGNISLNGFDDKGNACDVFKGQLVQNSISGNWSKPDGSKTLPFSVSESSNTESAMQNGKNSSSSKKDLLTSLIGEHSLQSISGFMGANTMMDYTQSNGKWTASGSMLSNGMREPYNIDLSKTDLQKLNSMKIIVTSDLSVEFSCNGKIYFTAPSNESRMEYSLKKSPKDYGTSMPENLQPNSTFVDGDLYLFAKDNTSSSEMESVDIAGVGADVAVLKYNVKSNAFELDLFVGDGGGNSEYTFK